MNECITCAINHRCAYLDDTMHYKCNQGGPYDLVVYKKEEKTDEDKRNRVVELETTSQIKH